MSQITFTTNRNLNINELKEVINLMELQEQEDIKEVNIISHIMGKDASINVKFDANGNIIVL